MRVAALCMLMTIGTTASASAQDFGGYVTAGSGSIDYRVHRETIPQLSAGVLWRLADDRVRIGGEINAMTSNGYWAGRGGPFAEFVLVRRARVSPFVRGGRLMAGEDPSWIVGAGVDLWATGSGGIRLMVQDAFRSSSYSSHRFHEPSFQVGWTWR